MAAYATQIQRDYLVFIHNCIVTDHRAPCLREIAERFNVSFGTVQTHLGMLQKKGFLNWEHGRPRTFVVMLTFAELSGMQIESSTQGTSRVPYTPMDDPIAESPQDIRVELDVWKDRALKAEGIVKVLELRLQKETL